MSIDVQEMINTISTESSGIDMSAEIGQRGMSLNDICAYRKQNTRWMNSPKFNTAEKMKKAAISEVEEVFEAYKEKTFEDVEDECGDSIMALLGYWEKVGIVDFQKAFERGFDKLQRRIAIVKSGESYDTAKNLNPK